MKRTLLITLLTIVLVLLPFLLSTIIGKYTPYVEGNSFQTYVIIWAAISVIIISFVSILFKRFHPLFEKISVGGIFLFVILCPIFGIFGLESAPDLGLKMLEHPEREHLRYTFLFMAAILFSGFVLFLFKSDSIKIKKLTGWIMASIFIVSFAEFIWEFTHHYLYPEGLKEWISQGKNVEEFSKNYDNVNILTIGVIGRYFQFVSIIWLSFHLYKLHQIKVWSPIINILLSLLGIVSATLVYITGFPFPKGFEFLMLFFIPGIPFFLLYWLGVALLTKFKESEMSSNRQV